MKAFNKKRKPKHSCKARYVKLPDLVYGEYVVRRMDRHVMKRAESSKRVSWCYEPIVFGPMAWEPTKHATAKFGKFKFDGEVIYA